MASASETVENYKAISAAEFFYKYKEIAGFANPARALYQTVRELVENALDATDAHGILPNIKITIEKADQVHEYYKITVEDNGIGIPPHIVPKAFGRVLFSSKYVLRQTRGMFGLGVKVAVLYGQMTTGRPVEIITSQPGLRRIYYYKLRIDINKNQPIILERGSWRKNRDWHGSIVSLTIEGDWSRSKSRVKDYIKRTAVVTPYANIVFMTPEGEIYYYKRVIDKLPSPPKRVKPHPRGVDLELLKRIRETGKYTTLYNLLTKSFQSIGDVTAKKLISQAGLDPNIDPMKISDKDLLRLVNIMKKYNKYRPPKAQALSPLGPDVIKAGLTRIYEPEFVEATTRKPSAYQGHPFIVEAGIAYGGKVPRSPPDKPNLLRYANKIPLLYDEGSDVITAVIKEDINWDNYLVHLPAPIVVLVHICSTKVPFKGVGKESIADVSDIRREIKLAISEVARKLRNYLSKKIKEEEKKKKIVNLAKYIPEVARALSIIIGEDGLGYNNILDKLAEIAAARTGIPKNEVEKVIKNVEIGT
ncbi:DNA topoisomerase VI subunit B [Staphylothermus hellenicus]|uniref:Type 2 DNA topoisomerase 6 subunit B n=1 Tax=Staphylothermus hellenicus (strain DSM 12710 / JCM 10830 / BK20S6-10-b1 / P8) TaxID=591019 RepID=D7D9X2_STAHD|nr:DNA topoisomerase VI subunit B [Staphylothermus hellenicus]ADI32568.1 DNA topoisomerase VI, B subunit [Staphylothermus hellenicus DSM 12710]